MDYVSAPALFKVKKVLRYVRLYGPSRTYVKVLGQIHMRRIFDHLPPNDRRATNRQTVGILGCGNYAFSNIAYFLTRRRGRVIRGVMDIDVNRAASLGGRYGAAYYTTEADRILADPDIRLVYIASNHASHAEYAIAGLERGKHVYIEKPHAVSLDQLERLAAAMRRSSGKVFLGFNRPVSPLGTLVRAYLDAETGPGMYGWFVAGHTIDAGHWYFKPEEGGRVLGNLCHWTDFTLGLVPRGTHPIEVNPTRATEADNDISVTLRFADGTIGVITFSSKEYAFEGVRETFIGQRGGCLLELRDFQLLHVERMDRKKTHRSLHRDQGHEANIVGSWDDVERRRPQDRAARLAYVWDTGRLALATRQALESDARVTVPAFGG